MSHNLHETVRKSSEMWKMSEDRALILENCVIIWIPVDKCNMYALKQVESYRFKSSRLNWR